MNTNVATRNPLWLRIFLGDVAVWFKLVVIACLVVNAALYGLLAAAIDARTAGFCVGWMILGEFIFFLAMALKCYPLLPGGLLAIQAVVLGLTSADHAYQETLHNFPVILLVICVVAGVVFLKDWLAVVFTALLFSTRSKIALSLMFCSAGAVMSAFLDALTVTAVIIAVCTGFHDTYQSYRSKAHGQDERELDEFRAFLRSLVMHALVGTALGGVMTMVGEPQNLLIAHVMRDALPDALDAHWSFIGFAMQMAVVTVPTLIAGLMTTVVCERFALVGYGVRLPERVREVLAADARERAAARTPSDRFRLWAQGACAALLVAGLAFHVAEVGMLGLGLIVLATASTGVNDEHRIGQAFTASMPFTALLLVFFVIVAVIADQQLFGPIIAAALNQQESAQVMSFFAASAVLSAVSDNVFVATVFINEALAAHRAHAVTDQQFEHLAIAINCGTNIPSIATPNGQAAFLFLLTSALAAPIRLGYLRMMTMALPYTIVLTIVSAVATCLFVA
ncbi:MAG: sodium/proton antiporter [Planctomycetes bacterium]|nr:sodium/proton antiporter [Planctomycetota bacterium]